MGGKYMKCARCLRHAVTVAPKPACDGRPKFRCVACGDEFTNGTGTGRVIPEEEPKS